MSSAPVADRAALTRVGLVLVATGVLSLVSIRGYLEESAATARDLTLGFALFFALVLLASARRPPPWSNAFALGVTGAAYLWGVVLVGGNDLASAIVVLAAVAAYRVAPSAYRPLVVAGFALWTPSLSLFASVPATVPVLVSVAALASIVFLLLVVLVGAREDEGRLRRIGLALLAIAIVSAVFERHNVVSSRVFAPDDAIAVIAVVVLALLAVARPTARGDALATGLALAAYALVGIALILGKGYHVDSVTAPHYAAEILLSGHDPYVGFDMQQSLARFGLPSSLATKLDDGSALRSLNYPAGSFLVVAPFVWAGLGDVRWIYLGEIILIGLLLIGSARIPWRPLVAGLIVGNTVLTRQYVLAGIDPTWALGTTIAWLFIERRWVSPVALGLAASARQPAWFFVPFYLVAVWKVDGGREALRRGTIVLAAFVVPNLPFIVDAPQTWIASVLAPMVGPLEPYGVGLVRLGVLGPLPLFPRLVYAALALAALAGLLLLLWKRWTRLPNGALTFPLVPLFFAWRSLQNYFVFLPLMSILRDEDLLLRSQPPRGATLDRARPRVREGAAAMPVDKELLEILACPVDKSPVREEGDRLVCTKCGRRYPVRDGIPVMLADEAELPA